MKPVLLDFDGVLVDSNLLKARAMGHLFRQRDPQVVEEIVAFDLAQGGVPRTTVLKEIYRAILREPLDEAELDRLCGAYSDLVVDGVVNAPSIPGAEEFLKNFYRSVDLFVVSGTPESELRDIVEKRGMTRYFKGVYGSPRSKVNIIEEIMAQNGYTSRDALFVGDAVLDYQAASHFGLRFVGIVPAGSTNPFPPGIKTLPDLRVLSPLLEESS
ncbi:hypothetical protein SY88_12520 [Clostridiales bacterium PH28_bin88]|nr:hypothetical protein SY88_12520 [Clostridiales bacterium PH28_bin88]